jgi:hypothetical protein
MKRNLQYAAIAFAAIAFAFAAFSCGGQPAPLASPEPTAAPSPEPTPSPTPSPTPAPTPTPVPDLFSLVGSGDYEGVKEMLRSRADVNALDAKGDAPLHIAAAMGIAEIVEYLLSVGAKPELENRRGETAILVAVKASKPSAAAALARRGAKVFRADPSGASAASIAFSSGDQALAMSLISEISVIERSPSGETLLHLASRSQSPALVEACLAAGSPINAATAKGRLAIDEALAAPASLAAARVAEILVRKGSSLTNGDFSYFFRAVKASDYTIRFEDGSTPLHEAVKRGHSGFAELMLDGGAQVNTKNSAGSAPLHEAFRNGDVGMARLLLARGADPNAVDANGNSCLHIAMPAESRKAGIELLLASGASVALKDNFGNTALHVAVSLGIEPELVGLLVKAGADVNARNKEGNTSLYIACARKSLASVAILLANSGDIFAANNQGDSPLLVSLKAGADSVKAIIDEKTVLQRNNDGDTPLHICVAALPRVELATIMIDKGADVNARNKKGDTPLHSAVRLRLKEVGELLLAKGADIFAANTAGEQPLYLALMDSAKPVDWLFTSNTISARDGMGNGPLHYVAAWDMAPAVEYLVGRGAPLEARNSNGETALFEAVKADRVASAKALIDAGASLEARDGLGNTVLHASVQWNAPRAASLLLLRGMDPDARNFSGKTALHESARRGRAAMVQLLLDKKANPNARDATGTTPLIEAIRNSRPDIAARLLENGAKAQARTDDGTSPLIAAVELRAQEIIGLLVSKGSSILEKNRQGNSPYSIALTQGKAALAGLIDKRNVNAVDEAGRSLLHLAIMGKADAAALDLLYEFGAEADTRDLNGDSPLHEAIRSGFKEAVTGLLKHGADIFASNKDADSPVIIALRKGLDMLESLVQGDTVARRDILGNGMLHYAASFGTKEMIELLLKAGAEKGTRNLAGETPFDIAEKKGRKDIAALLR